MKKPNIIAIIATTIDGKIAAHSKHSSNWTSPEDKDLLHKLLDMSDVIVVGNTTYKIAIKPLSKRNCIVFTRSVDSMQQKNDQLLFCNPNENNIQTILKKYQTVAVLDGTQVYTYFLENNMIDEIYLTVEPLIFGRGLSMFETRGAKITNYSLIKVNKLNQEGSILLHYRKVPHAN